MPRRRTEGSSTDMQILESITSSAGDLISRGLVTVRVTLSGKVTFEFDREQVKKFLELHQVKPDDFGRTLRGEVAQAITAILLRRKAPHVAMMLRSREEAGEKDFDRDGEEKTIQNRLKVIEKDLVTDALRKQFTIKKTSKTPVFRKLTWEVNEKHADEGGIPGEHLIYATLSLELQTNTPHDAPFPLAMFLGEESGITAEPFSASLEDVEELHEAISDLKRKLQELT